MKDFEEIVQDILTKHRGLCERLAKHDTLPLSTRERELVNYLIDNSATIDQDIQTGHNTQWQSLPHILPDIYLDQYKARALEIIVRQLGQFQLNPEEVAGMEELLTKSIGTNLLTPPEDR